MEFLIIVKNKNKKIFSYNVGKDKIFYFVNFIIIIISSPSNGQAWKQILLFANNFNYNANH